MIMATTAPAGATEVDDWADMEHGPENAHRYFKSSSWVV
jgi:hypothetical protein